MIKWTKLENICKRYILQKVLIITLSTSKDLDNVNSAVSFDHNKVHILLNASACKRLKQIIKAIAHELVHVILNNAEHSNNFNELWIEYEMKIKEAYS